jgi:hypothetical protein
VKKRRRNRRKPPRKGKKNFGGKRRFSAVAPPFLHSSILYPYKATAMQNLRPVTLFLVEFLCFCLVLVSKIVTFAPPPFSMKKKVILRVGES